MVFSSVEFLFFFLPIALGVYLVAPARARNLVLLATSVVFYTWGGGAFVVLLGVSVGVDYFLGLRVARAYDEGDDRGKRRAVALSALVNVGLLAYFKYANFAVDQLNRVGSAVGVEPVAWNRVTLPIGISFFTFQSMSYTIDVSRGLPALRNPVDFAAYVTMYPQLIAGPIVRYKDIASQLRERVQSSERFASGVIRFSIGLSKKVLVADVVAPVADAAFAAPSTLSAPAAWVGAFAYAIQIYFDFSGYSDMAIGLGRMVGFEFPENFRRPYSAASVTDFWRRWHITLSSWFRDYVYLPLGGSRLSGGRTYGNLIAVFVLTGIWHGAAWTFLVWGIFHGLLLLVERFARSRPTGDDVAVAIPRRLVTFLAVLIGWVIFRSPTLGVAADYFEAMISGGFGQWPAEVELALDSRAMIGLVVGALSILLPRRFVAGRAIPDSPGRVAAMARAGVLLIGLPLSAAFIAAGSFSPFLYFQF